MDEVQAKGWKMDKKCGWSVDGRRNWHELWKLLVKDLPTNQVTVALLNKLIKCCRLSRDHERAFFFFWVMNEYNLQPDVQTFKEPLKVGLFICTGGFVHCHKPALQNSHTCPKFNVHITSCAIIYCPLWGHGMDPCLDNTCFYCDKMVV